MLLAPRVLRGGVPVSLVPVLCWPLLSAIVLLPVAVAVRAFMLVHPPAAPLEKRLGLQGGVAGWAGGWLGVGTSRGAG